MSFSFRCSFLVSIFFINGCNSCTEQHDPSRSWSVFKQEQENANKPIPILEEDGSLPPIKDASTEDVAMNPIDKKYATLCASCHGSSGAGDGPVGSAMNPKPTNFVTWNYEKDIAKEWSGRTDEYIAKVIAEGGQSVGKSALMAAWGGLFNENELSEMVEKIKSFKNQ